MCISAELTDIFSQRIFTTSTMLRIALLEGLNIECKSNFIITSVITTVNVVAPSATMIDNLFLLSYAKVKISQRKTMEKQRSKSIVRLVGLRFPAEYHKNKTSYRCNQSASFLYTCCFTRLMVPLIFYFNRYYYSVALRHFKKYWMEQNHRYSPENLSGYKFRAVPSAMLKNQEEGRGDEGKGRCETEKIGNSKNLPKRYNNISKMKHFSSNFGKISRTSYRVCDIQKRAFLQLLISLFMNI